MLADSEQQLLECRQQRADPLQESVFQAAVDTMPTPVWRWPPPQSDQHYEVQIALLNSKIRKLTALYTALSTAALED